MGASRTAEKPEKSRKKPVPPPVRFRIRFHHAWQQAPASTRTSASVLIERAALPSPAGSAVRRPAACRPSARLPVLDDELQRARALEFVDVETISGADPRRHRRLLIERDRIDEWLRAGIACQTQPQMASADPALLGHREPVVKHRRRE